MGEAWGGGGGGGVKAIGALIGANNNYVCHYHLYVCRWKKIG